MSQHVQHNSVIQPETLLFPLTGVDAHAHLDMRRFGGDISNVLSRAKTAGVSGIGNVFLNLEAWEQGAVLFADAPEVFFLLGIHPTDAMHCTPDVINGMKSAFASDAKLRALGEIGLDFYWKDCPPDVQRRVFRAQLQLARELSLPVVIHSRDAYAETLSILIDEGFSGYPLLWHCFGGNALHAKELTDLGWHISIPGPVTFPANHALREALHVIPLDKLLIESDCPYLAPIPWRGKRNEPAYAVFTAACIAKNLGIHPAELWTLCGDNARRFFKLG